MDYSAPSAEAREPWPLGWNEKSYLVADIISDKKLLYFMLPR